MNRPFRINREGKTSPCKDCKKRSQTCHNEGECKEYMEYVEANKRRREYVAKKK